MWGNKPGWITSAVIALVMGYFIFMVVRPDPVSPPARGMDDAFKPIAFPISPTDIVPAGTEDCNAGENYRQAITDYNANPSAYLSPSTAPPGVDLVMKAVHCKNMTLFKSVPQETINYANSQPPLAALQTIGSAANTLGRRLHDDKKWDEAKKFHEAAFQLGANLCRERVTWEEFRVGTGIMLESADNLQKVADETGDGSRVDFLVKFKEDNKDYRDKLQSKVAAVLINPDENYAGRYAGDIIALAEPNIPPGEPNAGTPNERMWRVEAIRHLGMYRWIVLQTNRGDQRFANKTLPLYAQDPDPVIRTAATAAQQLTDAEHNMIGAPQQ